MPRCRHPVMPKIFCLTGWLSRLPKSPGLLVLLVLPLAQAADIQTHILLQDSPLAGFQYHAGKTLWPQMRVGDALALIREPDNSHDAKAVRVEWQGHQIGYVPHRENADVARFMDGGQTLVARITRLAEGRDPWSRVRFEILIPIDPEPLGDGKPPIKSRP